mmetsp:Transcript_13811/g.21047  ORF Transcript_13811/g.21047 Transcript_13811/m.21047 type:complete len:391 (-) Transcript_13811:327-1499(-)
MKHLTKEEKEDIVLAHATRIKLIPPRQSSFRVLAILYYKLLQQNGTSNSNNLTLSGEQEKERYIIGCNDEPCYMNGSICAERAALVQLRFIPYQKITRIVIVTDSPEPIVPGCLCREFLMGHLNIQGQPSIDPERTPIVSAGSTCLVCDLNISKSIDQDDNDSIMQKLKNGCLHQCLGHQGHHHWKTIKTTLNELYPYPSPYTYLNGKESAILGKKRLKSVFHLTDNVDYELCQQLIQCASKAAQRGNDREELHPIQYGAAVLFDNDEIVTGIQRKCLEYGCSQDAVLQLSTMLESKPQQPKILVQTDQYGVIHTPFATARAYLSEFGYGRCRVLVAQYHSIDSNEHEDAAKEEWYDIQDVSVDDISPSAPDMGSLHPTTDKNAKSQQPR